MPSFTISPNVACVNATARINVVGVGTDFMQSGNRIFTITGGSGARIAAVTPIDATHATLSIFTGSVAGILSINNTGYGLSASFQVNAIRSTTNSLQVYAKLADALDGSPLLTLVEMRKHRVRFDGTDDVRPTLGSAGDGDFPRWILWMIEPSDAMFSATPGFIDRSDGYEPRLHAGLEPKTEKFKLTIVHKDQRLGAIMQNEEDVLSAIRGLGPTLGFRFVKSMSKITGSRFFGVTPYTGGAERCETTLYLPVTMFFESSQLMP